MQPKDVIINTVKPAYLSEHEYQFIYTRVPRVCVDLLIKTPKGIVLSKRNIPPYFGYWHLPGGRIFMKEKAKHAVKRVAFEELNIKINIEDQIGYIEYPREKRHYHSISIVFLCSIKSGKIKGSFQAKNVQVFPKIPNNTIPMQKKFLIQSNLI